MKTNRAPSNGSIWAGLAGGVIAGFGASWTMNQFQSILKKVKTKVADKPAQQPEQQGQKSSSNERATIKAAEAFSQNVLNRSLADSEKERAGEIAHYAMGVVSGATYGVLARKVPSATWGRGLLYGTILWLTADEALVPALGFSKAPWEYPVPAHLSALSAHLVYATSLDLLSRGLRRLFGKFGYTVCTPRRRNTCMVPTNDIETAAVFGLAT